MILSYPYKLYFTTWLIHGRFLVFLCQSSTLEDCQVAIQQVCRSRNDAKHRKHLSSGNNFPTRARQSLVPCTDWWNEGTQKKWLNITTANNQGICPCSPEWEKTPGKRANSCCDIKIKFMNLWCFSWKLLSNHKLEKQSTLYQNWYCIHYCEKLWFYGCTSVLRTQILPSLKLTARTWKWMVGIGSFPFGNAYFQVLC